MKYHLCIKENDKNLLHIIEADDLKHPLYGGYVSIKKADDEEEAIKAVASLVEDFCKSYWDKGKKPDFARFGVWIRKVML